MDDNTSPAKRKPRKKRLRTIIFALFWMVIIGSFAGLIVSQSQTYNEMQVDLLRIQMAISSEEAERDDLEMELLFFDSDTHIERIARERLGMVRPYEIVFRNVAE